MPKDDKKGVFMKIKFLRFPDFKTKTVTLSYDDGVEQDIKLVEMMSD